MDTSSVSNFSSLHSNFSKIKVVFVIIRSSYKYVLELNRRKTMFN